MFEGDTMDPQGFILLLSDAEIVGQQVYPTPVALKQCLAQSLFISQILYKKKTRIVSINYRRGQQFVKTEKEKKKKYKSPLSSNTPPSWCIYIYLPN